MSTTEPSDLTDLLTELDELEDLVESPTARNQARETKRIAIEATQNTQPFGRIISGFDRADLTEALLGSVLFGIPMAVESGTQEAGSYISTRPLYLLGTVGFTIALVFGILYVADIQDVRVYRPFFGLIPRRMVGVLGTATVMAAVILTAWGRITWGLPGLAVAQIVVATLPMSIGAALGDILPGS